MSGERGQDRVPQPSDFSQPPVVGRREVSATMNPPGSGRDPCCLGMTGPSWIGKGAGTARGVAASRGGCGWRNPDRARYQRIALDRGDD
jgi:hypothetical protein